MEQVIVEVLKWLFQRTDPVQGFILTAVVIALMKINKKVDNHLDPKNRVPHPQCEEGERSYNRLCAELEKQHRENREDHQEMFQLLRGRTP